ncbi:hypothetical protein HDN1F_07990 [gamma proteobacterium HdN1]|nr:hypothetical protein HDN1F_07990 [gamma proteobacterium HdN1]
MMWQRTFKQCLFVLLALGLAACKQYTIVDPTANALFTTPPPQYTVSYGAKPATAPKMTLNGYEVQKFFVLGDKQAIAQGADLATFLKEGYNIFQVSPPLGPQVKFIYDTKGPDIVVLGSTINGSNITINGIAVDEKGVASGTVNGQAISFDNDGAFQVTIPKANVYTYQTKDTIDHTNTVHYADLNQQYNPAVSVEITQRGLDFATKQIVNALNGADLNPMIAGTMLYDSTWKGLFGETYGADGFVRQVELSAERFDLDLQNGSAASFDGRLTNVHIALTLRLHNGLLPPTIINVGATVGPLDIGGDLALGVQDDAPTVSISNLSYQIGNIAIDNFNVPGLNEIISGVVSGIANLMEGPISNLLEGIISDEVPKLIKQLVQDSYTLRIQDHVGRNFDMAAAIRIKSLSTTTNTLTVSTSGSVLPINPDTANIAQPYAGTLFTFDTMPAASVGSEDFAASINSNMINQVLASAHAVGLTQMNIVGDEFQLGLPRDDMFGQGNMRILVNMAAPARIQISEVDGKASPLLSVYGLEIHGQSKKNGSSTYTNDVAVRVNAEVGLTLGLGDANSLGVALRNSPQFKITGVKLGNGAWSGPVVNAAANSLITSSLGGVMLTIAKPIEKIKLPAFACMAFSSINITAVGAEKGHLNLAGTLSKVSDECDNPVALPPKMAYGRGVGVPMSCGSQKEYDAGLCYNACDAGYNGVGPVCWKQEASYGRGVGTIPHLCAAGEEMDAGLCYPKCNAGFHGVGPVCWNDMPGSYGRGVGTIPSNIFTGACPAGKENNAGLCYKYCNAGYHGVGPVCWLDTPSYGRGVGTIPKTCAAGEQLDAGLCYPKCSAGYHGVGPVCWTDSALSYGRGVGTIPNTCENGWDKDGLLCYPQCEAGYNGVGPVCWPQN